jgi:hypothetical protein
VQGANRAREVVPFHCEHVSASGRSSHKQKPLTVGRFIHGRPPAVVTPNTSDVIRSGIRVASSVWRHSGRLKAGG